MQLRFLLLSACFWLALACPPLRARGDDAPLTAPPLSAAPLSPPLERIALAVERRRQEGGVPGAALAIVQDDKVMLCRGFGVRDVEKGLPVTPDTLFRIGSTTKAFTAMLAEMSVDDGKLALDASPQRYLPYFKLRDPLANKAATLRDFLAHRSGLKRTDLAWSTGALGREEVLRVVGEAQPTVPLRSLFQYNNVGYSIVGEAVASAQGKRWDDLISERIFAPLGMSASLTSAPALPDTSNFALSYWFNRRSRSFVSATPVNTDNIAAATGIVSNASDMARWVRLMLNQDVIEGQPLVSRRGYEEMLSPQIAIDARTQYGLGWYLETWHGHRVMRHGGTIGSYRAEVALMPDQHLGFVLLANASSQGLQASIDGIVWSNLVANGDDTAPDSARELPPAGREGVPDAPPENGQSALLAGDDPPVAMPPVVTPPEQGGPLGNGGFAPPPFADEPFGPWVDLVGTYRSAIGSVVEIAWRNGRAVFVVPGGKAYGLIPRGEAGFALVGLSEKFALRVARDENGKVSGLDLTQPIGEVSYAKAPDFVAPLSSEELMARVIRAAGGEANLRRHAARVTTFEALFANEGVRAEGSFESQAPSSFATELSLFALDKPIGAVREYFGGESGGTQTNWQGQPFPTNPVPVFNRTFDAQNALADRQLLEWKTMFKSVVIKRVSHIGTQIVYVVEKTPIRGNPITDYVSTTSSRVLQRESPVAGWVRGKETYSDFRTVDGVLVPFKIEIDSPLLGDIYIRVKDVQFVNDLPDADFGPKKP